MVIKFTYYRENPETFDSAGVFFITHGQMVIKFTYYRGGPETFYSAGVFFITHGHMVIKFTYYRGGPETFDIAGCVLYHTWSHGHSVTRGFGFQGLGDENDDSGIN